jgi:hypothetical protein
MLVHISAVFLMRFVSTCRRPLALRTAQADLDFANGKALFPLGVLVLAAFSTSLVTQLLSASRITLSVAGIFALLALWEQ